MGYFVTTLVALGGVVRKNSRFVFLMIFGLLWVLIALSISNPDYENYKVVYDNINDEYILGMLYGGLANEKGFRLLYKIFFGLGFEYRWFLMIFSFVGLCLISKFVWKYSVNPNIIMLLYLIFPFSIDYVQIRTFMSMAIVLYALQFLIDEEKYSIPKYVIGVLTASMIHVSAIFFLMLVLIRFLSVKQCYYFCFIGIIGSVVLYLNIDLFADLLSVVLPVNKIKSWLSGEATRPLYSAMATIIVRISWMLLIEYFYQAYKRKVRKGIAKRDNIVEQLYKCNIILLVMLGLEFFTKQYERIGRITFLLGYIIFARLFKLRRTRALPWIWVLGILGVYFIYFMCFGEVSDGTFFEYVFQNMFENNWLFNRIS